MSITYDPNIRATLVYDDGEDIHIPDQLLNPNTEREAALADIAASGRMNGTVAERLTELASRACYDSLAGKGRSSDDFHKHIHDVHHSSVWGHFNYTVNFPLPTTGKNGTALSGAVLLAAMNRPGVWVGLYPWRMTLTVNLRAAVEWYKVTAQLLDAYKESLASWCPEIDSIGAAIRGIGSRLAPRVVLPLPRDGEVLAGDHWLKDVSKAMPESAEEKWISLYSSGSRGLTHEKVRHGWRTAISQRSTRYCDESASDWVEHPLVSAFMAKNPGHGLAATINNVQQEARTGYDRAVEVLQPWLTAEGASSFDARKQARGAARGLLGNGLFTEGIFSGSVAQWRREMKQRCHPAADAEIRVLYANGVLPALQSSRYAADFADLVLVEDSKVVGPFLAPTQD